MPTILSDPGTGSATSIGWASEGTSWIQVSNDVKLEVNQTKGIAPQLYFKYVKNKFKDLEGMRLDKNIKNVEEAFNRAAANGQNMLAEKILTQVAIASKEAIAHAKGCKYFIEREDLNKHKHHIRKGHISDTKLDAYTRIIPDEVIEKKKKFDGIFDDYVIYHYWSEEAKDVKNMSQSERSAMRDPVLFGTIKGNNRLYFIADWEDEFCDLTFSEIIEQLGKEDEEVRLGQNITNIE